MMEWLLVAAIGAVVGIIFNTGAQAIAVRMPQSLCLILGAFGGVLGGILYRITGIELFGAWSFYMAGVVLAIGLLAGGMLAYTLTRSETRM